MKLGRDMDAAIHRLMGGEAARGRLRFLGSGLTYQGAEIIEDPHAEHWYQKRPDGSLGSPVPAYTGTLQEAIRVLYWMQGKGSSITLNWAEDTTAWECSWITGGHRYTGIGGTAEAAICRAVMAVAP